jgi:hypothetical protein
MRSAVPALLLLAVAINAFTTRTALELYGQLPVAFLAGSVVYLHRVPMRREFAAVALLATAVASVAGVLQFIGPLTIAYLAVFVGMRWPLRLSQDLSFGVYIYGWPVESLIAMTGAPSLGVVPYALLALVPILGLAYVSARFVESPFISRRPMQAWRLALRSDQGP